MKEPITGEQVRKTITRTNLADALHEQVGLSRNECESLLEDVLNEITDCLATGDAFKMHNFASFCIHQKNILGPEGLLIPRQKKKFQFLHTKWFCLRLQLNSKSRPIREITKISRFEMLSTWING